MIGAHGKGSIFNFQVRNCSRLVIYDLLFAAELYSRVRPFLPPFFKQGSLVGLNERIKLLKYGQDQMLGPHYDNVYERADGSGSGSSLLTLQLYLNSGGERDFDGGYTNFINPKDGRRLSVRPRRGTVLIFDKALLHEGTRLSSGLKYSLRTGVMYQRQKYLK